MIQRDNIKNITSLHLSKYELQWIKAVVGIHFKWHTVAFVFFILQLKSPF